jgi:hypothetical protein
MAQMKKTAAPMKKEMAPAKSKAEVKKSLIQDITNRFSVTAREARDIVTAVGTGLQTQVADATSKRVGYKTGQTGPSGKNLIKQVKETAVAAATGKKGTTSDQIPVSGSLSAQYQKDYKRGTKRK